MPVTDTSVISTKNVSYSINEKSFSTKSPIIFRTFTNEAKGVLRHGKIFEDYFSEYQADMISICLEYAHEQADMMYIVHVKAIPYMVIFSLKSLEKF